MRCCTSTNEIDTPTIRLIDKRDNKIYWAAKLLDGKCWMTQNLDFEINAATISKLTSEYTNLTVATGDPYTKDYSQDPTTNIITWSPGEAGYTYTVDQLSSWKDTNNTLIQSFDPGEWYWDNTTSVTSTCKYLSDDCAAFQQYAAFSTNEKHGHVGNYYSWTAAVASSDTSAIGTAFTNPQNSICPAGWRLPSMSADTVDGNEFRKINKLYNNGPDSSAGDTDAGLIASPLYFVRGGFVNASGQNLPGNDGRYWFSASYSNTWNAYSLYFSSTYSSPANNYNRFLGRSVRCVAQ